MVVLVWFFTIEIEHWKVGGELSCCFHVFLVLGMLKTMWKYVLKLLRHYFWRIILIVKWILLMALLFVFRMSPSAKCPFMSFAHFIVGLFVSLLLCVCLYICWYIWYLSFIRYMIYMISPSLCLFLFILLTGSLKEQKLLILIRSSFSISPFMYHAFSVKSKNSLPSPLPWRFSLIFKKLYRFTLHLSPWFILR